MMQERSGKPVLGVCAQPGKGARGRCSARVPECDLTPSCAARVPPDDAGARAGRCVSNVEKLCQVSDPTAQWRFSPPLKFRSRKVKTFFLFLPLPPPPPPPPPPPLSTPNLLLSVVCVTIAFDFPLVFWRERGGSSGGGGGGMLVKWQKLFTQWNLGGKKRELMEIVVN